QPDPYAPTAPAEQHQKRPHTPAHNSPSTTAPCEPPHASQQASTRPQQTPHPAQSPTGTTDPATHATETAPTTHPHADQQPQHAAHHQAAQKQPQSSPHHAQAEHPQRTPPADPPQNRDPNTATTRTALSQTPRRSSPKCLGAHGGTAHRPCPQTRSHAHTPQRCARPCQGSPHTTRKHHPTRHHPAQTIRNTRDGPTRPTSHARVNPPEHQTSAAPRSTCTKSAGFHPSTGQPSSATSPRFHPSTGRKPHPEQSGRR